MSALDRTRIKVSIELISEVIDCITTRHIRAENFSTRHLFT